MNGHIISIDVNRVTDFTRLFQEVKRTKTPRKLIQGNETIVFLMPDAETTSRKQRVQTKAHHRKASIRQVLSLAGAWSDLPSENMEEDLARIRHASKPTPPVAFHL